MKMKFNKSPCSHLYLDYLMLRDKSTKSQQFKTLVILWFPWVGVSREPGKQVSGLTQLRSGGQAFSLPGQPSLGAWQHGGLEAIRLLRDG